MSKINPSLSSFECLKCVLFKTLEVPHVLISGIGLVDNDRAKEDSISKSLEEVKSAAHVNEAGVKSSGYNVSTVSSKPSNCLRWNADESLPSAQSFEVSVLVSDSGVKEVLHEDNQLDIEAVVSNKTDGDTVAINGVLRRRGFYNEVRENQINSMAARRSAANEQNDQQQEADDDGTY